VGDAEPLGHNVIHSVTNPIPRLTVAMHVYGGDFFAAERSEWDRSCCERSLLTRSERSVGLKRPMQAATALSKTTNTVNLVTDHVGSWQCAPKAMSGDGKRGVGHRPQATAPILDSTTCPVRVDPQFRLVTELHSPWQGGCRHAKF
jgi:hypothetical protein